ncbi:MAG: hypothetical protein EB084_14705 [Proteobacteria bacterium]|nr:hypothetical protein [Pseudomonadota bacterium]
MEGWAKLGSLIDKKNDLPQQASGASMLDRLAGLAARLERKVNDAFNSGKASRRFDHIEMTSIAHAQLEEVGETASLRTERAFGRFDHVSTMQLHNLEEISLDAY